MGMAKDLELSTISQLFLVLNADPKVARHDRLVGTDDQLTKFYLPLAAVQHAGVNKTQVWDAAEQQKKKIHGLLNFNAQCGARIIVKP